MNTLPKLSSLPLELCTKALLPFMDAGAPVVCLQVPSVGNFTPFRMRGRTNRSYRFEWDRTLLCHVLRIPAALWAMENQALAKDIYHQMLARPIIPALELAAKEAAPEVKKEPVMAPGKIPQKKTAAGPKPRARSGTCQVPS